MRKTFGLVVQGGLSKVDVDSGAFVPDSDENSNVFIFLNAGSLTTPLTGGGIAVPIRESHIYIYTHRAVFKLLRDWHLSLFFSDCSFFRRHRLLDLAIEPLVHVMVLINFFWESCRPLVPAKTDLFLIVSPAIVISALS